MIIIFISKLQCREGGYSAIAGLSFLGLGIQPPSPEWGTMLVDARPLMQVAPRLVITPGVAILVTVFGFNALAEGFTAVDILPRLT
jgi:ABC-type dipeptide/oligopeptide/nickel transport system permease subunit